ncbi:MAG: GntR family transcriptional regulator [Chroococcidiopsidaceae cyanobacterium CP_BM_ER_R8_30]|nr:GntR family transcriptional regulator [Chroococcidiopsidaceae cyanobacterium CP_BM_ER_R8_30]
MAISSQPLQRSKSLHEQTYKALRASILSGDIAPGARLVETQLAEQLQVSRTPVREAIRQLQREELVTADSNGGLRVTTISTTDAVQLYDCRLALEQLAVVGACEKATASQIKKLNQCVVSAKELKSSSSHLKNSQMLDLDYQFHWLIAESSGNPWLVSLLEQVFSKMALLRLQTANHNPDVLEIRNEHQQIYAAIAERNAEAATEAIQNHLIASKARVVQEIQNLQRRAEETTHSRSPRGRRSY